MSPAGILLPHLSGEGTVVRQVMAAHFLKDCDHIVEIGGAGLPISRFLTHHPKSVRIIDPKIEPFKSGSLNGKPSQVEFIRSKFQSVDLNLKTHKYGLVLLGLSLKPFGLKNAIDPKLLEWVDNAKIVVIEHSVNLDRASFQLPEVIERGTLDVMVRIRMIIEDEQLRDAGFSEREFLVLQPKQSRQ